jgi:predicted DNA-binding protein (UPF0278 family)
MNNFKTPINEDKISLIMRHTMYSRQESIQKLSECNNNEMHAIKSYMEIKEPETEHINNIKSINQEIYKQIRLQMNKTNMEYKGDK